jgi:NAD(P)H-dependent flavin oxidoreductase YrpB (nitropropane dioxygenase family)
MNKEFPFAGAKDGTFNGPALMSRRQALGLLGYSGLALTPSTFRSVHMSDGSKGRPGLETRLTREYGVRYPLVCAGMAFVGTESLAVAVANAGGIGMLGTASEQPHGVLAMIEATRRLTNGLFGVNFIVDNTAFGPMTTDAHIDVCVAAGVTLVTFHWNPPLRQWVDTLHASGARVWFQTGVLEEAEQAIFAGVDGIIAQGNEAGGHVRAARGLVATFKQIRAAVPQSTLVLAAGGIVDGRSAAKALALGADGVWVGTRLLASVEANAHDEYKRRLVVSEGHATAHTTMFGPEWPQQRIQVLRNRVVDEWAGREDEIPNPPPPPAIIGQTTLMPWSVPGGVPYDMPKFSAMLPTPSTEGDFEEMCMAAGSGVALIKSIKPAAEIVSEIMEQARVMLASAWRDSGEGTPALPVSGNEHQLSSKSPT